MSTRLTLMACACAAIAALAPAAAFADGSWLDAPLASWNRPGMELPAAPPVDAPPDPLCTALARPPETDEDHAVADAGWTLFAGYQAGWGIVVVRGLSGYDGMCRPFGFNEFVFVDGVFAGTISPATMNSRTDGVGDVRTIGQKDSLTASFARYAPADPLCCPSSTTIVSYRIDRSGAAPVLVPE